MAKEMQNISLLDVAPKNLFVDETVRNIVAGIDPFLRDIASMIPVDAVIASIETLPESIVDVLAWQWRVDFYDNTMPLAEKRNAVKQSIAMHRIKGTRRAVELALHMVYTSGEVSEWFEYGGRTYYFRVRFIEPENIRTEDVDRVIRIINAVKNTRSWLESIGFTRHVPMGLYHGTLVSTNKTYRLMSPRPHDVTIRSGTYHGVGVSVYKEVVLRE